MTKAEQLLKASLSKIQEQAVRKERFDFETKYTFSDGSMMHCRKLSGRSAFLPNGWHVKSLTVAEINQQ
jgi:hypothetical protein